MILILVGVAAGFGLGFGLRAATDSPIAEQWISELLTYLHLRFFTIACKTWRHALTSHRTCKYQ